MNKHTHHCDAAIPDEAEATEAETRDPVCGMKVKTGSPHAFAHDGGPPLLTDSTNTETL